MKTNELAGAQLALWTARASNICLHDAPHTASSGNWGTDYTCTRCGKDAREGPTVRTYHPDEDWAQGGPLLDRLMASGEWCIQPWDDTELGIAPGCTVIVSNYTLGGESCDAHDVPVKHGNKAPHMDFVTPTLLQAVCQAIVASVYGPNVPDGAP